jgi:hypothetical protein
MGYIINETSAFVNIKLTEVGRQKLAQGQLNFTSWGIGDSEINYEREGIYDNAINGDYDPYSSALTGTTKILRPFDKQPNIQYFITDNSGNNLNTINSNDISTYKTIVNNQAIERGFFSADTTHDTFITYTSDTYTRGSGVIPASEMTGGTSLVLSSAHTQSFSVGDFILVKTGNDIVGNATLDNTTPTPQLWYKIESTGTTVSSGDTVILDRELPNLESTTGDSIFIIYTSDEVYGAFGFETKTPYWDANTLQFTNNCDISCSDVPVWNMNNVWSENLAGMTGVSVNNTVATPNESFEKFGSNEYMGQKYPYFHYSPTDEDETSLGIVCGTPGESFIDGVSKSISILHYTNNTISNFYGEYFFIDGEKGKTLTLYLPDLMYNRIDSPTEMGTTMGMTFIATGLTKYLGTSDVGYVELIEDPSFLPIGATPNVVGKVFTELKTIVFDNDEIVASLSYKSNRNWTLPPLSANLISSQNGASNGVLPVNTTMYITYTFENNTSDGLKTSLPCQYYTKITNTTSNTKDIEFKISDIDLLPYMRKVEKVGYDGMGFSAKEFKVLYQIVTDSDNRPLADAWNVYDFTSTDITSVSGETIDPLLLENQNPSTNGFLIDNTVNTNSTIFSIMDSLDMPANSNTNELQFGDERFFYGNLETYIGATIFKTIFNINVSSSQFQNSSNPTRLNSSVNMPDIRVSEVGIYDSEGNLVMIGKLSKPVRLASGNTIMLELSMDF